MSVFEDKPPLTIDRAAGRFTQIRDVERRLEAGELEIAKALDDVHVAKTKVHDLRKAQTALLIELRHFARDEGDLPLFPFVEGND